MRVRALPTRAASATFLTLLISARAAGIDGCDCESLSLSSSPVCDADGLTYANACVARCQGARIVRDSACSAPYGPSAGPKALSAGGDPSGILYGDGGAVQVGSAELNRFKAEGFKLLAQVGRAPSKFWEPRPKPDGPSVDSDSAATKAAARPVPSPATIKVTEDGLLYGQPESAYKALLAKINTYPSDVPPAPGSGAVPTAINKAALKRAANSTGNGRALLVTTPDSRVEVQDIFPFPFSAVGYVEILSAEGFTLGGCSGALIGPATVLTAGHCIFDTISREFYPTFRFYPARHSGGRHCHSWMWDTCLEEWEDRAVGVLSFATMYTKAGPAQDCGDGTFQCQLSSDFTYDVAVLRLAEVIGPEYGTLGIQRNCATAKYSVTSAGYPGDLDPYQARMFLTAGTLGSFYGCSNLEKDLRWGYVTSDLDIYPGQSGSAVWDAKYYVRALVNAVEGGSGVAWHRTMTSYVYNWLVLTTRNWSN